MCSQKIMASQEPGGIVMPEPEQQTASTPAIGALLSALGSGGQVDALGLLRSQMQSQLPNDPQTALLLQLLDRRQPAEAAAVETDAVADEEVNSVEKQQALSELKEKVDALYAEVEALRKRNDTLALALGACYLCFGEDPLCEECQGRGLPGSRAPEPDKFRKYVLPAYRRAKYLEPAWSQPPRPNNVGPDQSAAYDLSRP